jgi:hypothetical protein
LGRESEGVLALAAVRAARELLQGYAVERFAGGTAEELIELLLIDKNSLWGELNIQKGELCVKGFLLQHLGFVWGPFQQGFGGIWG